MKTKQTIVENKIILLKIFQFERPKLTPFSIDTVTAGYRGLVAIWSLAMLQ